MKMFGEIATKTSIGRFYVAVDPAMKARKSRPDNIHRFVENLSKRPPQEPVNYKTEIAQKRVYKSGTRTIIMVTLNHEMVEDTSQEFGELKDQYKLSQQKLQRTEKTLSDATNQ